MNYRDEQRLEDILMAIDAIGISGQRARMRLLEMLDDLPVED